MVEYPLVMQVFAKVTARECIFLFGFFLAVLTVTPYSVMDPINLPKMSILGVLGFTLLGALFSQPVLFKTRSQKILVLLTGLFIFHSLLILLFSGRSISQGFYGVSGRNTGFLTYFCCAVVLFSAAQISSSTFIRSYLLVFIGIGLILTIYGMIQNAGLEPFPYINIYENNVFGTFGNPNFQSAFMGIFGALLFAQVLNDHMSLIQRLILALFVLTTVYGVFITNSWQGYFNFAVGIGIVIILNLFRLNRKKLGSIFLGIGILVGVIVLLGLLNQGPLASALEKASLAARQLYWEAAFRMLVENPIFGVGWDGFGDWYRRARTDNAATNYPGVVSDSAHSVPLDVASSGGFPLLILYLALVILGVFSVIKVVKNKTRLSIDFIALVAAWGSYQAQSLISINQIGLGIIGWSLLGLIIGYNSYDGEVGNASQKQSYKPQITNSGKSLSFFSISGPLVGFIVGGLISLPPFLAANKFYEGMKTSDARVINANGYLKPLDLRRMLYTANILEKNRFYKESFALDKTATKNFPDSYEAWRFLATLTNASEADKNLAKSEIDRLDPSREP
jgi:O-antigen ligase